MRKYVKNKLIDMAKSLYEMSDELLRMIRKGNKMGIIDLLSAGQETAAAIGETVEKEQGQNNRSVELLEAYCELLWRVSQEESKSKQKKLISEMRNQAANIRRELERIEAAFEIVFLPYKVSMWDSMESIWKAACEDKRCACYVLPIPYYDKTRDGALHRQHYEGDLFPEYVPITSYQEYSLEQNHPDIIYFHNPYDGNNLVTSVHPSFFSTQLRNCTDMLVYVPYYISLTQMPEGHKVLPGYQAAHRIILPDRNTLMSMIPEIPEEKLAAIGSPKVDFVLELCSNPPPMPEEWTERILRLDGTRKKLVLYNTSISGVLKEPKLALKKMLYVFTVARKTEEIVLVWRPHPLLESTIRSMIPGLEKDFLQLKTMFLEEKIGIYDTNPVPEVSLSLCSAYIGEETSSMVTLFNIAGKPVFLLNPRIVSEDGNPDDDEAVSLTFVDMVLEGNEGWFVSNRYQAICRVDLSSGEAKLLDRLPDIEQKMSNRYGLIHKHQGKLYLTPMHADSLCIYDIEKRTFQKVAFHDSKCNNFCDLLFIGDEVLLKPLAYPGIIRWNEKTREYRRIDGWVKEYQKLSGNYEEESPRLLGKCVTRGGYLWTACAQSNHVMRYDLETDTWKFFEVGQKCNTYQDICFAGERFWLLPLTGNYIVSWDPDTGEWEDLRNENQFWQWQELNDRLLAIPFWAEQLTEINLENRTEKVILKKELQYLKERKWKHWKEYFDIGFAKKAVDGRLLLFASYDNSLLLIDIDKGTVKKVPVRLDLESFQRIVRDTRKKDGTWLKYEEDCEICTLQRFLKYGIEDQKKQAYGMNLRQGNGKNIHQYIMEQVNNQ